MIKLYKRIQKQTLHWEAWDTGNQSVMIHWGTLGDVGHNKNLDIPKGASADTVINRESAQPRSNGYTEINIED